MSIRVLDSYELLHAGTFAEETNRRKSRQTSDGIGFQADGLHRVSAALYALLAAVTALSPLRLLPFDWNSPWITRSHDRFFSRDQGTC